MDGPAQDSMPITELRVYSLAPGRRADFDERFVEVARPLFAEHGFRLGEIWDALENRDTFVYTLRWRSVEERDDAWGRFADDPRWRAARKASEEPVPLVLNIDRFMLSDSRVR